MVFLKISAWIQSSLVIIVPLDLDMTGSRDSELFFLLPPLPPKAKTEHKVAEQCPQWSGGCL